MVYRLPMVSAAIFSIASPLLCARLKGLSTTMKFKEIYPRLKPYVYPQRRLIAISAVASWGVAATDGAMAKMVQPFVDKLIIARDEEMMLLVPLLIVGLQGGKAVCRYAQEYYIKTAGQLAVQSIRNDVFEHTMRLSMRYHTRTSTGVLMSRVTNDIGGLQSAMAELLVGVMRDVMALIALIGVAFYTDWRMATIAFISLPVAGWPVAKIGRKIKEYSRRSREHLKLFTVALEQSFSGVKVIKGFGAEKQETERFRRENENFYQAVSKVRRYDAASAPFIEIITGIGAAAVVWYGMHRVIAGDMTQGQLFSVLAAIMLMYAPFKRLTKMNNYLQVVSMLSEQLFRFLDEPVEIADRPGARELGAVRGEVVFERVSFAYDSDKVLDDCSLHASLGEVIALVGPSGAGKTTIVSLLERFYDPTGGRILIDGIDIRDVTLESLKRNLSMVDQESFLFNGSIDYNIRFGAPGASDEAVRDAARQAHADEFINALPEGYQTSIGNRGLRLSGGQRQRICIARALLRNAPILILDEATSALDTESEALVQDALANLMKNRTTFVIAHRLSTIMHADKIVVVDKGRIVEAGTHTELIERGGLYRKLYDMQFREA